MKAKVDVGKSQLILMLEKELDHEVELGVARR